MKTYGLSMSIEQSAVASVTVKDKEVTEKKIFVYCIITKDAII